MSLTDTQCPFAQWLVLNVVRKETNIRAVSVFMIFLKEKEFRLSIIILVFLSILRVFTEDIETMLQQTGKQKQIQTVNEVSVITTLGIETSSSRQFISFLRPKVSLNYR